MALNLKHIVFVDFTQEVSGILETTRALIPKKKNIAIMYFYR
jgi:hypothetical protein